LNYFIDVKSSLVAFQQYSVGFLSGVAGGKNNIFNQWLFFKKIPVPFLIYAM
jgi:hypothetical protein